jgi:hypothetical protein
VQRGGGGGTGGFSVDVTSNDMIKSYAAITPGNCATVPARAMYGGKRNKSRKSKKSQRNQRNQKSQRNQRNQRGGNAATVYGLQSYTAGYDLNKPVETPGGTAHYLDWTAYDKTCKGGSRRNRKSRKSRRSRN